MQRALCDWLLSSYSYSYQCANLYSATPVDCQIHSAVAWKQLQWHSGFQVTVNWFIIFQLTNISVTVKDNLNQTWQTPTQHKTTTAVRSKTHLYVHCDSNEYLSVTKKPHRKHNIAIFNSISSSLIFLLPNVFKKTIGCCRKSQTV